MNVFDLSRRECVLLQLLKDGSQIFEQEGMAHGEFEEH